MFQIEVKMKKAGIIYEEYLYLQPNSIINYNSRKDEYGNKLSKTISIMITLILILFVFWAVFRLIFMVLGSIFGFIWDIFSNDNLFG